MQSIIKRKDKLISLLFLSTTAALFILLLLFPTYFKESTRATLYMLINSVIPSLFSFIVISKIIVSSGLVYLVSKIISRPFTAITGLPPSASGVFLMSFLTSYPTGAVGAVDLYREGELTHDEAQSLIAVCNNTGPALPVMIIAAGKPYGWWLYIIHILSAVITAFVMKKDHPKYEWDGYREYKSSYIKVLTSSVKETLTVTALLCAYVVFFSFVTDALSLLSVSPALFSFLEIVSGSAMLTVSTPISFVILASALSFGGICIHMQTSAVCAPYGFSMKPHFKAKVLAGIISALFACVYVIISTL